MTAKIVTLCEDIKDYLNTLSLSFAFTASHERPAYVDIEQLANKAFRVFVYPVTLRKPIEVREAYGRRYDVNVHICKKLLTTEINDCLELAEELEDALEDVDFDPFSMLQFASEIGGRFPFEIDTLNQQDYFHVPITVQYISVD